MPANKVELVSWHGDDVAIAKAAWVSTGGGITEEKRARIPALLASLAANEHGTPFEHSQLTFLLTTEIATHIQMLRHRHFSYNVESARYREIHDDRLFVPADWTEAMQERYERMALDCLRLYHELIEEGVDSGISRARMKESARFIRPYGAQISYYATCNFRALIDFLELRLDKHAQMEIRTVAEQMLAAVVSIPGEPFSYSLAAFGYRKDKPG